MRYVIMIQIVSVMTLVLLGASAMFAWLQNRSSSQELLDLDNSYLNQPTLPVRHRAVYPFGARSLKQNS